MLWLLSTVPMAAAAQTLELRIGGEEIPVQVHAAEGDRLILWLPSEYGISERAEPVAAGLATQGVEVWMPDLHAGFFLPPGPYSLLGVPRETVAELIRAAHGRTGKTVYLMAAGRTVPLALQGARDWQASDAAPERLGGALLFHPKLYRRTPQGGEEGELLPVTRATNLPVYLIQPTLSAGVWRLEGLVEALEAGGSPVFVHRLAGVSDDFHVRGDATEAERAATQRLPALLARAVELLEAHGGAPRQAAPLPSDDTGIERPSRTTLLNPVKGRVDAPGLELPALDGGRVRLAELDASVVLVNFWATWCPPCVEEIPSLNRLYERLADQGLEILAVDVGEPPEKVRGFLRDKPTDFPVLLDAEAEALRSWQVYAFPTTFVVDAEGRIRYAVYGAFSWDSEEVVETLQALILDPQSL